MPAGPQRCAGKTTAVRILTTLLDADGGSASVAGADVRTDPAQVRKQIGLSGQNAAVDENLTGFENLDMVGRLYRLGRRPSIARARELLEQFDLADAADRPVKTYSGGMRRRLDLAASLVANPPVLFPTNQPRDWTPEAAPTCWTSSAPWSAVARPCCSPPSTSKRPTASPTTSS
ncbi:hypothetical protein BH23ACT10_BH23ACT10_09670 [soil metagenome]